MHLLPGTQSADMLDLRLRRLERENWAMKRLFILTVLVAIISLAARSFITPRRIEAGSFVVKDHGIEKAVLGPGLEPGQGMLKIYGGPHHAVVVDAAAIGFFPSENKLVSIDPDGLVIATEKGSTKITPGSIEVFVPGSTGSGLLATTITPGKVEVSAGGLNTVMGQSETVVRNSGEHKTSSGASIQMFKGSELIWEQVP